MQDEILLPGGMDLVTSLCLNHLLWPKYKKERAKFPSGGTYTLKCFLHPLVFSLTFSSEISQYKIMIFVGLDVYDVIPQREL